MELAVIWFMVASVVALVVVLAAGRGTWFKDATVVVPGAPGPWLEQVVLQLSGQADQRVRFLSPTVLEVVVRRRPAWTLLAAVLAFPIGLIALFFTVDDVGTLVATDEHGVTRVQLRGRFTGSAIDAINRTIPDSDPAGVVTG